MFNWRFCVQIFLFKKFEDISIQIFLTRISKATRNSQQPGQGKTIFKEKHKKIKKLREMQQIAIRVLKKKYVKV